LVNLNHDIQRVARSVAQALKRIDWISFPHFDWGIEPRFRCGAGGTLSDVTVAGRRRRPCAAFGVVLLLGPGTAIIGKHLGSPAHGGRPAAVVQVTDRRPTLNTASVGRPRQSRCPKSTAPLSPISRLEVLRQGVMAVCDVIALTSLLPCILVGRPNSGFLGCAVSPTEGRVAGSLLGMWECIRPEAPLWSPAGVSCCGSCRTSARIGCHEATHITHADNRCNSTPKIRETAS
jgi:hypothetical protein